MPAPISVEERATILRAHHKLGLTYDEVAKLVGRGRATVNRIIRLERETGGTAPRPKGGGRFSPIAGKVAELLLAIVTTMPDATVAELVEALEKKGRVSTSRAAVTRALKRLGVTRKKRASSRPSATRPNTKRGALPSADS
jgi:transposase